MQPATRATVRPVEDDQWAIVGWLWQAFRQDLALIVDGLPYADGRYQAGPLDAFPSPDTAGYLAWSPHPRTGEDAPIGFALVDGLTGARRSMVGFWVAPVARRHGTGRALALDVIARHPAPWTVGVQHENVAARTFWAGVADIAFGPGGWSDRRQPVPRRPDVPADHLIESVSRARDR